MEIYFDNAATTAMRKEVLEEMLPYFTEKYGNASSIYKLARESKISVENSREVIASSLNADKNEIYFTSGGTEADNWAIKNIAESYKDKGKHIITSTIEHHAVFNSCEYLEKNGFEVTYVSVDKEGIINLEELKKAIRKDTILITIMFANNEIGTIQPIKEIGEIAKENEVIFHTDAVQAFGHVNIDVKNLNIDLLSVSAHKIYGPKGVGALFVKKGIRIRSYLQGGAQERNRRAGTENVPGIVGFAKATELAHLEMEEENKRVFKLREQLINGVLEKIPNSNLNGHREKRLPGNANITFDYIEGEAILLRLDFKGVSASSGSACTSGSLDPSHVLLALGLLHEQAHGSLRLTLGRYNTEEEVKSFLEILPPIIKTLRELSPLTI